MVVAVVRGSNEPLSIPVAGVDSSWSATAALRVFPAGPALQEWSSQHGSAAVEDGVVRLFTSGSESWEWTTGDVELALQGPSGPQGHGPVRVRLRGAPPPPSPAPVVIPQVPAPVTVAVSDEEAQENLHRLIHRRRARQERRLIEQAADPEAEAARLARRRELIEQRRAEGRERPRSS